MGRDETSNGINQFGNLTLDVIASLSFSFLGLREFYTALPAPVP
jgi:hypothetical protein